MFFSTHQEIFKMPETTFFISTRFFLLTQQHALRLPSLNLYQFGKGKPKPALYRPPWIVR
jgi:hypothetical protein